MEEAWNDCADCADGTDKETGDMKEQGQTFYYEFMLSIFY